MPVASTSAFSASSASLWWMPPPATISEQAGGPYGCRRVGERGGVGGRAAYVPDPLGEEVLGPVVRLRLDVLRQGEGDGAGLGGVGEHAHGVQRGRDQRLGAYDAVEVPRDRAQRVVDRDVAGDGVLKLLEHRVGDPGGEGVAGQQQDGDAVDGGERGAGDEVGGAGADGGGDGLRGQAVELAGVADGGVHHGLLVAALVVGHQVLRLDERLADPGDVPVAEDAPGAADQPVAYAVALGVLGGQEPHERLGDGQAAGRVAAHQDLSGAEGAV